MLRQLENHKIKIVLLTALLMASAVSLTILAERVKYTTSWGYGFLAWNLILAWVPLFCAVNAFYLSTKPVKGIYGLVFIWGLAWLAFFPNAPYILTDLLHLSDMVNPVTPTWYDVVMLSWFAWTGQLLGVASMYIMQEIITNKFNRRTGWLFSIAVIFLSGFGVYLGRFQRFNSWDVVNNPVPLAREIVDRFVHPASHPYTITFTLFFSLLFLFIYFFIHAFGDLKTESSQNKIPMDGRP